jgi:hypothetical protein
MEKYSDAEQAVVDKINYRKVDTACCLTCGNGEKYDGDDSVMCRLHTYYNPEMEGGTAYWFGDLLGICDTYKKKKP